MLPNSGAMTESGCLDLKVSIPSAEEQDQLTESQSSPIDNDDDACSDGVTDKSSLGDESEKKDGSGKKRKRRVSFTWPLQNLESK